MELKPLPPLAPHRDIDRPLSLMEYYFASIGRSAKSQEDDCEIIIILEGNCRLHAEEWQAALSQVVEANPACRLRMAGKRQRSRWRSDAVPTRLRIIDNCDWDGRSGDGADFIKATRLNLEQGPSSELIVVPGTDSGTPDRVMIRAHHAVMDGLGIVYFFQELFRALRGEPLQGSNAAFSDADLMQSVASKMPPTLKGKPASLTGGVRKAAIGNVWRRITIADVKPNYFLGKLAILVKQFARRYSQLPVRILLPVNLRRHCEGLNSMLNFTGLIIVELDPADEATDFRRKLRQLVKDNAEANHAPGSERLKWLPMSWIDWIGARFARHENTRDTVGISNFGVVKAEDFSCDKFSPQAMFALPAFDGNAFIILAIMGNTAEVSVGMPLALASEGRFEDFVAFLQEQLQQ